MMNRYKPKKKKLEFNSEKQYIDYYNTLSITYKSIHLNKWNILFSEILILDPKNILANHMIDFCKKEQEFLKIEKQKRDQEVNDQLKTVDIFSHEKKRK